jgi:hypothetical protein
MEHFGKPATEGVLRHLRQELVQAIWMLLMDDEFMHTYIHGFDFWLIDKILRLFFPRFMIYSADYPEKLVLDHDTHTILTCSPIEC